MSTQVYCRRCRQRIDKETYDFWQGTAWCNHCRDVVGGSYCKVPSWVIGTLVLMTIHLQIVL
jgi:hypothetical protein